MRGAFDAHPKPVPAAKLRRTGVWIGVGIAVYEAAVAEEIWCHAGVLAPLRDDVHILRAPHPTCCPISRRRMKVFAPPYQLCLTQRRDPA